MIRHSPRRARQARLPLPPGRAGYPTQMAPQAPVQRPQAPKSVRPVAACPRLPSACTDSLSAGGGLRCYRTVYCRNSFRFMRLQLKREFCAASRLPGRVIGERSMATKPETAKAETRPPRVQQLVD